MSEGEVVDLTVKILKDIRSELQKGFASVNHRLDGLTDRVDILTGRVDVLTKRVDVLTSRVENIRDFAGARVRDHEVRIRRLESRLLSR